MKNITQKLIANHLLCGKMTPGREVGLKIDQTLMQDATGTMVMLELEALGIEHIKTELSVQYVDHNILQTDFRNADDHQFLLSACKKFGIWYSRPGNGVSHAVHLERFGVPCKTLLGSDSHTCSAGAIGMLALGAGGVEVASVMAGEPLFVKMPSVHGIKLTGVLPPWVSAKDVILELLRRHGVKGGVGKVFEYYGPGLSCLSVTDRLTIANMGAELGATTSVFPSDSITRKFLQAQKRESAFVELNASRDVQYDSCEELCLSTLEPLIALPGSPGNVVAVKDVIGKEISQSYIGSSANPGLRDIAIAALIVDGEQVKSHVSLDINPASRQVLENLAAMNLLEKLIHAGARIHQAGCNGCIGMGQAPGTGKISLRTVPRNFFGRSGTQNDQVYLCSPETAVASAINGVISDPRSLKKPYPQFKEPEDFHINKEMFLEPNPTFSDYSLEKGPNIKSIPVVEPMPSHLEAPVMLKIGDNISTDDILPAGAKTLPFRSNIAQISSFVFSATDPGFVNRVLQGGKNGFIIVAGTNYGQGSSREHAALAPRYLGLIAVLAKSFARIHWQNLVNFGVLPVTFKSPEDYETTGDNDILQIPDLHTAIKEKKELTVVNKTGNRTFPVCHTLSVRQIDIVLQGGLINTLKNKMKAEGGF